MLLLCYLAKDNVFFWDTIQLGSKHGHWYYENAFQQFLLPLEIDSGHIPAFGMYIALCWFLFGKSLAVSHFAMLPFLFGTFYYAYRIARFYTIGKWTPFLLLLLLIDPVFAGQSILVSPDIALLCFFLMALTGILEERRLLKWIGLTMLPLVSMRGMMVVAGMFLFEILRGVRGEGQGARKQESGIRSEEGGGGERGSIWNGKARIYMLWKRGLKAIPWYIPGGVISLAFLIYHYKQAGWIGYHPDSPWAVSYERVGLKGIIRNVGVLGWRMLDYGRVFLWMGVGAGVLFIVSKKSGWNSKLKDAILLFSILLIVLGIPMLMHRAILAHRYLLPVYFSFSLIFFLLWFEVLNKHKRWRSVLVAVALIGLGTGNFWVYPKKVAQGWDSTLAHWPHYQLRTEMIEFIKREGIALGSVGTAFPEIGPFKFKDLSNQETGFAPKDLNTQNYILYANTMNDFSDSEIDELGKDWEIVHQLKRVGVCFVLYRRKN